MRTLTLLLLLAGALGGWAWMRSRPTSAVDPVEPGAGADVAPDPAVARASSDDPATEGNTGSPGAPAARLRPEPATPSDPDSDPEQVRWIRRNNEAVELLRKGQHARAVELLEGCHEARPANDDFRRNLVEALKRLALQTYGQGEIEPALELLDRAIELGHDRADRETLRELAARWRRELEAGRDHWTDRSLYFELSYDADRFDLLAYAQTVLDELERVYGELRDWFGRDPILDGGRPRLRVVLYEKEVFSDVTGLGDWAGGAFDGVIRVSLDDLEKERSALHATLRHELVHAFIRAVGNGRVPGWLDEGLAQWLELKAASPRVEARRAQLARERLAGTTLFPLERLRGSLATWDDPSAIRRAYAQSFLLVRRIATDPNYGEEVLRRMVLAAGRGESPAAAFETATSVPLSFVLELVASGG